jgi:hypothetical protein
MPWIDEKNYLEIKKHLQRNTADRKAAKLLNQLDELESNTEKNTTSYSNSSDEKLLKFLIILSFPCFLILLGIWLWDSQISGSWWYKPNAFEAKIASEPKSGDTLFVIPENSDGKKVSVKLCGLLDENPDKSQISLRNLLNQSNGQVTLVPVGGQNNKGKILAEAFVTDRQGKKLSLSLEMLKSDSVTYSEDEIGLTSKTQARCPNWKRMQKLHTAWWQQQRQPVEPGTLDYIPKDINNTPFRSTEYVR